MNIEIFEQAPIYLKLGTIALVTALCVEACKIWLKRYSDAWYYKGTVIICAFLFAVLWSIVARVVNLIPVDGPVIGLAVMQSVIIAALATGGYEQITKLWTFAGSGIKAMQQARSIDTQVNIDNITEGDQIEIRDIHDSSGIAVGKKSQSETGN